MNAAAPHPHRAWIALGANLGPRERTLRACLDDLSRTDGIAVVNVSPFFETDPVGGPPNQPRYLNGAAELSVSLAPDELLNRLLNTERIHGRQRDPGQRNAPRTADLDLLLYDNLVLHTPDLTLPHPRLHERAFVLAPLCAIGPDLVHPVLKKTMRELLAVCEKCA